MNPQGLGARRKGSGGETWQSLEFARSVYTNSWSEQSLLFSIMKAASGWEPGPLPISSLWQRELGQSLAMSSEDSWVRRLAGETGP